MTCFRMPDGTTVRKYCLDNNIPYEAVYERLDKGQSIEQALRLDGYVKGNKGHSLLYYKGRPLTVYCGGFRSERYRQIVGAMHRKKLTVEQAVHYVEHELLRRPNRGDFVIYNYSGVPAVGAICSMGKTTGKYGILSKKTNRVIKRGLSELLTFDEVKQEIGIK